VRAGNGTQTNQDQHLGARIARPRVRLPQPAAPRCTDSGSSSPPASKRAHSPARHRGEQRSEQPPTRPARQPRVGPRRSMALDRWPDARPGLPPSPTPFCSAAQRPHQRLCRHGHARANGQSRAEPLLRDHRHATSERSDVLHHAMASRRHPTKGSSAPAEPGPNSSVAFLATGRTTGYCGSAPILVVARCS
jgi:hypothetical protein